MAAHGTREGAPVEPLVTPDPFGDGAPLRRRPPLVPGLREAVSKLVADRPATADAIVSAPAPLRPIDLTDDAAVAEVLDLAVRMGEVVLASGTAVTDTQTTVRFIAATYGLNTCDVEVTYNSIRIYVQRGPALPPASSMRVVHYRSLDFTRLAAVDRLTRRIREEVVPAREARAALDAITTAPHPYNRWVATFGWSLMAAAIAVLLGGGPLVTVLSFVTTAVIDRTNRTLNRYGLPFFFQHMAGGAIAAAPAVALAAYGPLSPSASPTLIIAAGITVLLSGLSLVGAVQDAITGAPITASARMLELLMMTGAIIAGIVLALQAGQMFGVAVPLDLSPGRVLINLPVQVTAGALAAVAFSLACYAERRALTAAAGGGALGTICYLIAGAVGLGPVLASGAAAIVIGMAGGLLARRTLTPPLVVALAGITPLLPGLSIYRGLYGMMNEQYTLGADQLLSAFGIGCALAGGVIFGEWFDRTVSRPPILRKFGSLARPVVQRTRRPVSLRKHRVSEGSAGPGRGPAGRATAPAGNAPRGGPQDSRGAGSRRGRLAPAGRGTAPVPGFDHENWTRELPVEPEVAMPAAEHTDMTPAPLTHLPAPERPASSAGEPLLRWPEMADASAEPVVASGPTPHPLSEVMGPAATAGSAAFTTAESAAVIGEPAPLTPGEVAVPVPGEPTPPSPDAAPALIAPTTVEEFPAGLFPVVAEPVALPEGPASVAARPAPQMTSVPIPAPTLPIPIVERPEVH